MKIKDSGSNAATGSLEVLYKHQDYGNHPLKLEGRGHFSRDDVFFYIIPKNRDLGGHRYYMGLKFRTDLEAGKTYTLDRNDEPVTAHLEIDDIRGDKYASGTFHLSKGAPYPEGEFTLFEEGVFSVEGTFAFTA